MTAQATTPAAPPLLLARWPQPARGPGPMTARATAKADRVQTIHAGHLHWPWGLLVSHWRWAPGPSPAPPVRVHGPIRTLGWLEPMAPAVLLLRLFPRRLILGLGTIAMPWLVNWRTLAPLVAGRPSAKWSRGCPAAAQVTESLGHGSGASRSLSRNVLKKLSSNLARFDSLKSLLTPCLSTQQHVPAAEIPTDFPFQGDPSSLLASSLAPPC